ncbi:uncharacterized protein N0V89_008303 [Didymosphaeria variabile]|uniref:Uncharacterized protein n=1 Tax=Didymosphaeria variabile TaxID=1932322 RepID=A0A9W9C8D8_9PLEO|nr:uncharacterized protein N0V89_008303 [Didymosphaeria variabile]KAJ4349686.1 hypothetical protein N0V89_008303 [Didymosphaeria variabile]
MTATPSASTTARRRVLHPIGTLSEVKDPEAEAASTKIKEEDGEEMLAKKKTDKLTVAAHEVITPPSSSERPKRERKAKTNRSLAEVEVDLDDDDPVHVRDHLSPFGGAGSKRRLDFKDASSAAKEQSPNKRACVERPDLMKAPTPHPAEWDMSSQQKAELQTKTYSELFEVHGIRPSQHPTIIKDKFGVDIMPGPGHLGGQPQVDSVLHRSVPTPYSRPMKIPMMISRNGKPRKSGEEIMEEVRDKVRMKLHKYHGWPHPVPAFTITPPAELPAGEPREGNLRDLVDHEVGTLHHNLTLDEDQQSELVFTMRGAARKFGNNMFKAMPAGFRAMAKSGLDLALEHLTYAQQQQVVALVQTQAGIKLKEFEAEANFAYVGPQHNLGPDTMEPFRESFQRST